MSQRKIFNYSSKIIVQSTIDKFGYSPDSFGISSAKFVVATCRYCGQEMDIRKGFFNKSGSACHKKCKIEEMKQQKSPFSDPEIRDKSKKVIKERYGVEYASQNKDIAKKISIVRSSQENQEKIKKTNMEKYGVENVFQSEEIKEKIKTTNLEKYGHIHHMTNKDIQNKVCDTLLKKYGVDNLSKNNEFKKTAKDTFKQNVIEDNSNKYTLINTLRSEEFWNEVKKNISLKEICNKFNLNYLSVAPTLNREEFKERFKQIYSYPKTQTQKEIKDLLEGLGISCEFNTRQVISPFELDVFVPSKNFAIEFNGSYWHSEAVLSSSEARNKHWNKTKLCREKGIRLFHIFEHSWRDRKVQIMNFIKSILGLSAIKIAARKCEMNDFPCDWFLNENHIQKPPVCLKYFNLIYNNQTIACMTASRHHRQNIEGNPVVLSRLCFKDGVTVQGGATKLFKYFVEWSKSKGYDRILSWSDNTFTEGGIYRILGFELINEYGPDYFYWDMKNDCYLSKQSQKKGHTGCPKEITERNWCYERGLYRIYDCGKKLWEFIL
jgi:hypothetical protein